MLDFNESIFDLVATIEYPYNVELLDGIPKDTAYLYISTTYLNGFINYTDEFIYAFMFNHYSTSEVYKLKCINVDNLKDFAHTDLSSFEKFDDIIIVSRVYDGYIVFWSDMDCSDSCIIHITYECISKYFNVSIDKDRFILDPYIKTLVNNMINNYWYDDPGFIWKENFKEIPVSSLTGWVTL